MASPEATGTSPEDIAASPDQQVAKSSENEDEDQEYEVIFKVAEGKEEQDDEPDDDDDDDDDSTDADDDDDSDNIATNNNDNDADADEDSDHKQSQSEEGEQDSNQIQPPSPELQASVEAPPTNERCDYKMMDETFRKGDGTTCPICQLIPHVPVKLDCCGLTFCRACITSHSKGQEDSACPLCNANDKETIPSDITKDIAKDIQEGIQENTDTIQDITENIQEDIQENPEANRDNTKNGTSTCLLFILLSGIFLVLSLLIAYSKSNRCQAELDPIKPARKVEYGTVINFLHAFFRWCTQAGSS